MSFQLLLIFGIMAVLIFGSSYIIREYYRVEQLSLWRKDYVNAQHKEADRMARYITIVLILIATFMTLLNYPEEEVWYLNPFTYLIGLSVVRNIIKAIMEKRYVENIKYYKATIAETVVLILIIIVVFQTNFFKFLF